MDSPLAPVLASIFMGFRESKLLNEYNLNKPKFYLIYVDDILATFNNKQDSLNFLNNRYPNIKCNIEKKSDSTAFLDLFISDINNQNFTLPTYRKSTYTGLVLNFKSFTSFSYKLRLIKCLIDRSFKICNNWISFHNDIENIKSKLLKNAYPPFFITKIIIKYVIISFLVTKINQKTNVTFITLNYHISATFHIILKENDRNFAKSFVKKILTLS